MEGVFFKKKSRHYNYCFEVLTMKRTLQLHI